MDEQTPGTKWDFFPLQKNNSVTEVLHYRMWRINGDPESTPSVLLQAWIGRTV